MPRRSTDRRSRNHAQQPSHQLESLEPRVLLSGTPELAGLELADPDQDSFNNQVVHLDFDGAEDVTYDGPVQIENIDVPAFEAPGELAGSEQAIAGQIVASLNQTFADTDVTFTLEQPDQPHSTIYVGGDGGEFKKYGNLFGISEQIDKRNENPTDVAFVFSSKIENQPQGASLVEVIGHEAAHLTGYTHVYQDKPSDLDLVAYKVPVHGYLAEQSIDLYSKQFVGSDLNRDEIVQGAADEDSDVPSNNPWNESRPYARHFWAHDSSYQRIYNEGLYEFDSAPNRANKYFTGGIGIEGDYDDDWGENATEGQGIFWQYDNGRKSQAFNWIGRTLHLIEDILLRAR